MAEDTQNEKKAFRRRELDLEPQMSTAEALMWRVGSDPWLDPSGSLLAILDQPADIDHLKAKLAFGVTEIPRLAERVVEGSRIEPPHWELDPEFDLDHHVSEVRVPEPGDRDALLQLTIDLHTTPYDPDRPPWLLHSVVGMADGSGALIGRMHHSIADGIGAMRMTEAYIDLERDAEPPPAIDLDGILAERAESDGGERGGVSVAGVAKAAVTTPLRMARAVAGEAAMIGADKKRLADKAEAIAGGVKATLGPLLADDDTGSPLWTDRSGARVFVTAQIDLESARGKAKDWGGTINDLFVTALAETGAQLHEDADLDPPALSMSYVRSTRSGSGAGGNAFTPTPITAPAGSLDAEERFRHLREAMAPSESSGAAIPMDAVGAIVTLLPDGTLSSLGRRQGRKLDIVTSNLRGSPIPLYIGGARVTATFPIGPLAGAASNATVMSYNGSLDIGVIIDPAAIPDTEAFRATLQATLDRYAT